MIYKTKEEKTQLFNEAKIEGGYWGKIEWNHIEYDIWKRVRITGLISNLINDDDYHLRLIEPKKLKPLDFYGALVTTSDLERIDLITGFEEKGILWDGVFFSMEVIHDNLYKFSFDKGETWKTFSELEDEL